MTTNYLKTLLVAIIAMGLNFSTSAQCLDWLTPSPTSGYTDINSNFGGAPCDDGTGCPFNELGFEAWASEAYTVDNFVMGGTYSFSLCNGPGAGSWVPEFTIISPNGTVDAFGAGDGDGCTITWTCSESGTYLLVINEAGDCGIGTNSDTDNGLIALTCVSSPETTCPAAVTECNAGELQTTGTIAVCPGGTFDVQSINDTIPNSPTIGEYTWQFNDGLGGTGGLAGGFTITGSTNMQTWDNDLSGILSSNGLPVLQGLWVVHGAVASDANDPINTVCSTTADSLIVNFSTLGITSLTDNGDLTATVVAEGGTMPYAYEWSDGQMVETAVGLVDATLYYITVSDDDGCEAVDSVIIGYELLCNTGAMTTTGAVTACDDESVDVQNDGMQEIPPVNNGAFGWFFDNTLGGTGGLNGPFTLLNIPDPSTTSYDRDLNGVLSANGFPVMEGSWTIQAVVYQDEDPSTQGLEVCFTSTESLIITFSETPTAAAADNGDGTATASGTGGTAPYSYEWSDGQTTETAIDLITGTYMVTVTEEFGCSAVASVDVTTVAVDEIASLENIDISPNPTNGNFQINLALNTAEVVSVEVLNVVGRKVQSIAASTITNEIYNIDLNNESEGVYMVRLNIGDKVLMRRVVLNK